MDVITTILPDYKLIGYTKDRNTQQSDNIDPAKAELLNHLTNIPLNDICIHKINRNLALPLLNYSFFPLMDFNNIVYHNQEIIPISIQRRNYAIF